MKILHIINNLGTGGAEKLLVDSLPLFRHKGIDTDILLLQQNQSTFLEELKKKFNGTIFYSGIKSLYNIMQIKHICKYIDDYEIVHVHLFPALYWVALTKLFVKDPPVLVFTEHNTNNNRIDSFLFKEVDKIIYKRYDAITAITPEVKTALIQKLRINTRKIHTICNGIDINKYNASKGYKISEFFSQKDIRLLTQVSRFSDQKDQKTVIKALTLLPEKYCVIFVGDGKTKLGCVELVNRLGIENRVVFLGVRADIPELLKTADIIIQSSNWEGFGLAAVEGMATGKPVIASNVPGLANIVKDAGILFEKGNETDLAEKILSLESQDKYDLVSKRCLNRANDYDLDFMVESYIKLYQSLLTSKNKR